MNDTAFLRLMQVFDSQFPIGHFAHSGGIETYADMGMNPSGLSELLLHDLQFGWGRLDLSAAAMSWRHAHDNDELNRLGYELDAWKPVEITRQTSINTGRLMLNLAKRLFPELTSDIQISSPHQSIIAGAIGGRAGWPVRHLLLAFGGNYVNAAVTAAIRCMPLSPEHAQEIIISLQQPLADAVELAIEGPKFGLTAFTPALDIRRQQQTALQTRLFRS